MFAIVEIAGKQYKVEEGQEIYVHRLKGEEGDSAEVGRVLLSGTDDDTTIGTPALDAPVTATILEHVKDDKVVVFKKKRRKGYKVKKGHRQALTKIKIDSIS